MSTREKLRPIRGNVYGSQGQGEALDVPRAFLWRSAAHNIANGGGAVAIEWDTAIYDVEGMWSSAANTRLTIRTQGIYAVNGWLLWPSDSTSYRELWVTHNGALEFVNLVQPSAVTVTGQSISRFVSCNAGDYLELKAAHNSATNPLVLAGGGGQSTYDIGIQACLISTT